MGQQRYGKSKEAGLLPQSSSSTSRMVLKVTVPKAGAKQLLDASLAADSAAYVASTFPAASKGRESVTTTGSGGSQTVSDPSTEPHPPSLTLEFKSDFHETEANVAVRPYRAAVLGTSQHAAALLQVSLRWRCTCGIRA